MTNLVAYFKQKPKTGLAILGIALVLTAAWMFNDRTYPSMGGRGSLGVAEDSYGGSGNAGVPGKTAPSPSPMPPMSPESVDRDGSYYYQPPTAGETAAEVDQKLIKNGYLQLLVEKVVDASAKVGQIATTRGGFIQSSSVTERGDGTYTGDISVRVPVAKFEEAMAEIKKLATLVKHETATGQDVTEQYSDLEAQLRNAKAQEEVYLEILKQADDVEEVLLVQDRLGNIRSVIESLEGRLKYLENATSFSTITVSLEEEPIVRAPTKEFRFGAIVRDAVQTLVNALQDLVAGLVYAIIVWGGILLPIGLIAWIVWKLWKKRHTGA